MPRVSATPPAQANERRELFVADQHASIQNARPVLHHLSSLLEDLGLHLGDLRSGLLPEPDLATLALDLDEVYVAGEEEVSLTVRPSHAVKTLRATLEPAGGGEPLHHELPESGDGTHVLSLDGLDAGEWRVTVRGEDDEAVLPVVGLFSVFDPGERPQAAGSPEPATGADDRRGGGRFRGGGTFRGGATLRGGGTSRRGGTLLGGSSRQGPESAGGGAGDAAQGEATLDVLLSAEAPEQVTVGAESVLDVRLDLDDDEASPLAAVLSATVDAGEDITVLLSGRGTVRPAEGRLVRVPPPAQGEPRDLQFLFRAVELGRGHLTVGFQQGGTRLGTLRLDVEAVEAVTDDGLATARARSASRRVDDDEVLTLLIDEEEVDGRIRLCFWVFSPAAGLDYRRFEATRSFAREERQAYFDKLHERAVEQPLSDSADLDCFERRLRAAGADLGQQVLPDALVRRLWDVRDKIGSIKVVSEDPYVPWELVRLTHPDDRRRRDERFLAEYGLVRAWSDPMAPRELPRGAWRYVQSTSHRSPGKPSDIGGDIGFFDGKLRARGIRAEPIAPQDQTVLDALAAPDFDVLHFSCHGHAGLEGGTISRLVLGCRRVGGRIRVIDLQEDEVRDAADLSSRRPLVFLNACESGRQPRLLTMHGGWPRTFCEAGAGAFVGTSWSVRDQPAKVFAGAFYDRLLEGGTLAEAASAARAAGKRAREGSWLAYTVYGDPLARFAAS